MVFPALFPVFVSHLPLERAEQLLARAFAAHPFNERLMLGRQAQLGDQMVYRPGQIGTTIATELTYGEV